MRGYRSQPWRADTDRIQAGCKTLLIHRAIQRSRAMPQRSADTRPLRAIRPSDPTEQETQSTQRLLLPGWSHAARQRPDRTPGWRLSSAAAGSFAAAPGTPPAAQGSRRIHSCTLRPSAAPSPCAPERGRIAERVGGSAAAVTQRISRVSAIRSRIRHPPRRRRRDPPGRRRQDRGPAAQPNLGPLRRVHQRLSRSAFATSGDGAVQLPGMRRLLTG